MRRGKGRREGQSTTREATRARDVDALVREIAKAMVDGVWAEGELATKIAAREQVSPITVDGWASQAGRLLRMGPDVEAYRGINLRRLDAVYEAAKGDPKARVAAIGEQNKMLGLHAPTRVDLRVEKVEALDDEQLLAKVDEEIARLTELRTELLAKRAIEVPALVAAPEGSATE